MKSPSKNRGAASVLVIVIVVIVIVGWTIGMFMQGRPKKESADSGVEKESAAQVEAQKKAGQETTSK
jgi:flagellar basal body-associated protein FliL